MPKTISPELTELAVNTIRMLAVDGVEKANSGHPGLPMGAANFTFTLWSRYLRYNPQDPAWPNRDRFILSAGHGSMLLYSMLHLAGFNLPIEELQQFRQWGSKTPGHPEYGHTVGVETTTGPLGAGFSNGVGMAIAEKMAAARYNTAEHTIVDHYIYALVSDGDLMEGVASEAASLAGHLKLGNLIYIYDDNKISIEGSTDLAFTEDRAKRFESYGWQVITIDGHDCEAVARAVEAAQQETERPSLIVARTQIAYGSPNKVGTAASHGAPLGSDEVIATKKNLNWPLEPTFYVPDEVRELFAQRVQELKSDYNRWKRRLAAWKKANPALAQERQAALDKKLPADLEAQLLSAVPGKPAATRRLSGDMLQKIAALVPYVVGGSADLAPSNSTLMKGMGDFSAEDRSGRNLHFGVREHAMGGVVNGIALYGGFISYGATFLVFADYMRPTLRLASIMGIQSVFIFTHDSIFVGEDGPTHEPIEHLASLRVIPRLTVLRPADGAEVAEAWTLALRNTDGPVCLILTRQNVPVIERDEPLTYATFARGGYIISETAGKKPDVVLVATGSELQLAVAAKQALEAQGKAARVVSMPSVERFLQQPKSYQRRVIPAQGKKVVIEAASRQGWDRIVGNNALFLTQDDYGASAPAEVLAEKFGFTPEQVKARVLAFVK
ncbi:MAG: transketolase [Chloroflexi bacterium]|nr:transketolase [Chloroflexota bacterium]